MNSTPPDASGRIHRRDRLWERERDQWPAIAPGPSALRLVFAPWKEPEQLSRIGRELLSASLLGTLEPAFIQELIHRLATLDRVEIPIVSMIRGLRHCMRLGRGD